MTDVKIEQLEELRELLAKATVGDLSTAERHTECETVECPACHGVGEVEAADYCNFDGAALGVQFYGIGPEFGAHEKLWRAITAALPVLLDTLADLTRERDALRIEVASLSGRQEITVTDQHGNEVGKAHRNRAELLREEAFVDDNCTAWMPPTAWAYRQACLARDKHAAATLAAESALAGAIDVMKPFADVLEEDDPADEADEMPATVDVGSITYYDLTLGDFRALKAFIADREAV